MIITHKLQPMDLAHKQNTIRVDVVQDDKYSRNLEFTLGGEFPTLPSGETQIACSSGVTVVEITPIWRSL